MSGRYDPREARRLQVRRQTAGLDLFAPLWPETPPAVVEQEALPLPDVTIRGRWVQFRATADGERVYQMFCRFALEDLTAGTRLSAKALWERCRATLRVPANNDFTPLAARDAESDHPELRGQFAKRARSAA